MIIQVGWGSQNRIEDFTPCGGGDLWDTRKIWLLHMENGGASFSGFIRAGFKGVYFLGAYPPVN